jgi:uncharacterized membrane protein YgcG
MTSTPTRPGRLALAFLTASTLLGARAHANADALDCDATVHDPDGLLDREVLDPVVRSVSAQLDADVRVRVEGTLDAGLDRRIDQLVEQCPGWQDHDTEELADDMVIVSFSRVERENSIFYGAELGPVLERRWDAATDAMIPGLQASDYTDAVIAGLRGLTHDPTGSTDAGSSTSQETTSNDSEGISGAFIFWLVVIGLVVVLTLVAKQQGWSSAGGGSWDGDDDGGSTGWFGGRRRSSFRSFGSFGSRSRSTGGSSRRSGGGSRRAGGGSKKW